MGVAYGGSLTVLWMGELHRSSSREQQEAEPLILAWVAAELGVSLTPTRVALRGGSSVEVDGVDDVQSVFVEIYARQGTLKGGQIKKVAQDILKLALLGRNQPGARLLLVLASADAAQTVRGRKWLAEAVDEFGVEVLVADLDDVIRDRLKEAQTRQIMINPPDV